MKLLTLFKTENFVRISILKFTQPLLSADFDNKFFTSKQNVVKVHIFDDILSNLQFKWQFRFENR